MKIKILAFFSVVLFLVCSLVVSAQDTSILAIDGSVYYIGGATLAPNGWDVNVTNKTKTQLASQSSTTGDAGGGRYSVTFMDILGGIVASINDEIEVTVTDAAGDEHSLIYAITGEDIDRSTATIDVVTNASIMITNLVVNGTVYYDDGKSPVSDDPIKGKVQVKVLDVTSLTDAEGKYSVSIDKGGDLVAYSGGEITVTVETVKDEELVGNKSLTLGTPGEDGSLTINVDIVTNLPVPPEPIYELIVSGTVYYDDEKTSVVEESLTVKVLDVTSVTDAEGKYSVSIDKGGDLVASAGDEITITVEQEAVVVGNVPRILGTPGEDGSLTIEEVDIVTSIPSPILESGVLAIDGTVFLPSGELASNDLKVDVTNKTKTQLAGQFSATGDAGDGRYSVTFMDILGGIVATTGDEIEIVVTDAGGERARLIHHLTTAELRENKATIDVTLDAIQKLTVSGTVYAEDGETPVPDGLAVKVDNPSRNLEVDVTTTTDGKYNATLVAIEGEFAAASDERIVVTVADEEGNTIGSVTHTLSDAEVVVNKAAVIDVVTEYVTDATQKLTVSGAVYAKDGETPVPDGLVVKVANPSRNLDVDVTTVDSKYSATLEPGKVVARTGEEIVVTVADEEGNNIGSVTHTLSDDEVLENQAAVIDVVTDYDATQKLTVSGAVYAKDGKTPVPDGLAVKAANPSRELEVDTTTAEGGYSVTLMDAGKVVARTGEEIVVTVADEEGNNIGSVTHTLSDDEVLVNQAAVIDVVTEYLTGLSVAGNVFEAYSTSMAPDVAAIAVVTHEGTGLTRSENIANGKYYLIFPDEEKELMKPGDKLIIEIRSVDGKILFGSTEHILTETELDGGYLEASDITTNRVSQFTIQGIVRDGQGNTIEGAIVSALSGETSTDVNGEYTLVLTNYAENPIVGEEVEVSVVTAVPPLAVVQRRKMAFTVDDTMLQNQGVDGIDVSIVPVRIGGLTLDTSQPMNFIDKAVARAGVPIKIRDNPQYHQMIIEIVASLGDLASIVPAYLIIAPTDTPPKVFEQWQNMDLENFGNPILPYPLLGTEYLEALTDEFAGSLPAKIVGNKLDLYLVTPEYAGDVSFKSGLGTVVEPPVKVTGTSIPHRFQLEEELALLQLPAWPATPEAVHASVFSSVTLYYADNKFEAPESRNDYTNYGMTEVINGIDGKVVWTASPELELGKKYYYFFEVELKQPFNMVIGGEEREVSKWVMPDPRNLQAEDRGLLSALFRTGEWLEVFRAILDPILKVPPEPIPDEAIPPVIDYISTKSGEIIADILEPTSPNYLDPQIVSEFRTPSVGTGESLWLANFDVEVGDGDYGITINIEDTNGDPLGGLDLQIGVDRRAAPVTPDISSGQNTLGYFHEADNVHIFASAPGATTASTLNLTVSPGRDTVGMVFQVLPEGQSAWSTNNSVLALVIALAQHVDPELAERLAQGSASPEEIKELASKLNEADPAIQELYDSLGPTSQEDLGLLLEVLGQISADPTNLSTLQNLLNVKDFANLALLASQLADLSVSPIAFLGKNQVMLLPEIGDYWVRVVPFDNMLNVETSDIPTRIKVVTAEADIVKIIQISLDANDDGDVDDRYEKGDYSVDPPERYTIFFEDDAKATLTAGIVKRTGNPFDVVFQYAFQSMPDSWQDIKTVTWDEQQGDTIEVDWVFGEELKVAFKILFDTNADRTQPLVSVRAVATNKFNLTDPSPDAAGVLLDEVRSVSFDLLLRAGLSMFSIPLANSQASIADGAPVAIEKVSDLKTLLSEDTPIYYYSASDGKFEQAPVEMEITGDLALITLLLEDTIIKFEGEGWPNQINLVPGLNMFGVPLDANQTVGDLKALLGEGAPVYYYHREEGKFQEGEDDMTIEGGAGYITLMIEPKTISIDGDPWENEGVPPELLAAPSFFDPTATLLMEVQGNVIDANTDTAFNDLSVTVRHLSSNAVMNDTTDDDGQFSAVFLDIFNNQSYRVGDVFKIDVHSNSGDISFESIQYTVTQEDIKLGRIILSDLTAKAIPKHSKLLQNWPNPFNPETWIPFQLSKDADVTLTIYDIHGRLVHRFDLGYVPAGIYRMKDNAIHWNGTNSAGERVSSGVYFYHIQAGSFSASRKMVILK